jgi:RNA polymerase sigma factor (sigma-70 family)
LLSDPAEADDIVQETCLAFLRRLPRSVEASGAWLGRVVRNLVWRSRRAKERREERERRAARPERITVTADQVVEKAEVHRLLVEEVLRLDEPYRSTVLLRFFGEQTPLEIARAQEVPLDTVKTRLRRAIRRLRARIDHRFGGRETWSLGILPLAGGTAAFSSTQAGAATATAGAAGSAATGGASAAASISNSFLGGLIMTQKTALTVGLIGIITIAGGFGLGRFTSQPGAEEVNARLDLRRAREAEARLKKDVTDLAAENERLAAAKAGLEEKKSELEQKTSELSTRVEELETKTAAADKPGARRGPRLVFQDLGELEEALMGADWREMAEATAEMSSWLKEANQSDIEPTQDQQIQLRLREQKLMAISLKTMNKLPSHISDGNGGITHPIIHWNLLAERLELAGLPLSETQVERLSRLGVEYDAAWEDQGRSYGADTLVLEKILNELELKRTFNERLLGMLTRQQREVIVDPALHDTYPYDLHSPLFLIAGKIEPVVRSTRDGVRKSIEKTFTESYDLSEDETRATAAAFAAWLVQVEPLLAIPLASRAVHRVYFFRGVEALTAGRAQVALMREILAVLPSGAAARGKLLNSSKLYLPRLAEDK